MVAPPVEHRVGDRHVDHRYVIRVGMRPLHALLLGAAMASFSGTLATDIAYASTYEIQWSNFAAWLLVGGLVFGAMAMVCALLGLRRAHRTRFAGTHFLLWLATWVLAFFNALVHAKDAWAIMPAAPVLSAATLIAGILSLVLGMVARTGGEA